MYLLVSGIPSSNSQRRVMLIRRMTSSSSSRRLFLRERSCCVPRALMYSFLILHRGQGHFDRYLMHDSVSL